MLHTKHRVLCCHPCQVDPVLKKLQDRYRGPEPSDMVEMFEGEQFFAAFEGGISIDMGMVLVGSFLLLPFVRASVGGCTHFSHSIPLCLQLAHNSQQPAHGH